MCNYTRITRNRLALCLYLFNYFQFSIYIICDINMLSTAGLRLYDRNQIANTIMGIAPRREGEYTLELSARGHRPHETRAPDRSSCRSIFLTEDSTLRRGRRVLPVTLGPHHKPFGSARTARGRRALDLVGALHALRRAARRRGRENALVLF